jgi:hypothetical protein
VGKAHWVSVGGVAKDEVLSRLYFAERRRPPTTLADMMQRDAGVSVIPGGRVLLVCSDMIFSEEMAAAASVGGDAIYGWMSEVVTASYVAAFVGGVKKWSVESAVDREPEVVTEGDVPPSFAGYMKAAEAEDNTFEVPFMLSAEFGNYRPDIDLFDPHGEMWLIEPIDFFDEIHRREVKRASKEAARAARAEKGGLLSRIFGRK